MAKRYGLAPQVVAHAEQYLAEHMQTVEQQTLKKLQSELEAAEMIKKSLLTQQQELIQEQNRLKTQQQSLVLSQQAFDQTIEEKTKDRLDELEQRIDAVIKALANPDLKLHEAIALKQSLSQQQQSKATDQTTETFQVDDYVRDQETGLFGRIVSLSGKQARIITNDGLTIKVPCNRLSREMAPKTKDIKIITDYQNQLAPASLNIIGLRYEEAKVALQQYYDRALTSHLKQLKIIHGFGSGTLKKLVYDYFSSLPAVKKIQVGEGEQSGYGVTLIYL
jgi:DNA mismatch repair protein MutS2